MSLDQKITLALTTAVINSLRRTGREKLQELRMNLDLDQDGRSDIDQAVELVEQLANGCQSLVKAIDLNKLASSLEKLSAALSETVSAIDIPETRASLDSCGQSSAQLIKLIGLALANYKSTSCESKN